VSHKEYAAMGVPRIIERLNKGGVFADVKSFYEPNQIEEAGATLWRL
jgi:UDP-N-acetyl-D-glucosamine/UDP-N-acetyl-D-galactosamine dehydrogenase